MIWLSHWHLKNALHKLLYRYKMLATPLADALDYAFQNRKQWDAFCVVARQANFPPIETWLDKPSTDLVGRECLDGAVRRVAWQLDNMKGVPTSTSALEDVPAGCGCTSSSASSPSATASASTGS